MKKEALILFLAVLTLVGCNTEVVPASNVEVEHEQVNTAEADAARGQFQSQVTELTEELEKKVKEVGYLIPPE